PDIGFVRDKTTSSCRRELTLYSLNAAENSGPLKQRFFPEDYRRDSKHHVPARTPPANRLSGLAVTDRPFSLSALKVTLKIRGNKYAALALIPSSPRLRPEQVYQLIKSPLMASKHLVITFIKRRRYE
ncbi:hypothetical protein TSAR_002986, partial [Trichomalopsis sarcophagae]